LDGPTLRLGSVIGSVAFGGSRQRRCSPWPRRGVPAVACLRVAAAVFPRRGPSPGDDTLAKQNRCRAYYFMGRSLGLKASAAVHVRAATSSSSVGPAASVGSLATPTTPCIAAPPAPVLTTPTRQIAGWPTGRRAAPRTRRGRADFSVSFTTTRTPPARPCCSRSTPKQNGVGDTLRQDATSACSSLRPARTVARTFFFRLTDRSDGCVALDGSVLHGRLASTAQNSSSSKTTCNFAERPRVENHDR